MKRKIVEREEIGKIIKHLRVSNNLTQDYMSSKLHYDIRHIRRLENEGTHNLDTIQCIADMFGVDVFDILAGDVFLLKLLTYLNYKIV